MILLLLLAALVTGIALVNIHLNYGWAYWVKTLQHDLYRLVYCELGQIVSIIGAGVKVPGVYMKVSLGVGGQSSASGPIRILCVGNMLAAGTATVNALEESIGSPEDAATRFGAGSELHLMCAAVLDANPAAVLDAIACSNTAGDDTAALVFSGTATEDGQIEIQMLGESVFADVTSGDAAATVAAAVEAAIDAKTDWPVTAGTAASTVTVTAKSPRGHWYIKTVGSVAGITHTNVSTTLSGGSATDDPQTALDNTLTKTYGIRVAAHEDATNLAKYKTTVLDQAEPLEGRRGRFIGAARGTLAATTTVATGLNESRGQLVWQENSWHAESYIAAAHAGETSAAYEANRAANLDGQRVTGLLPQPVAGDWPTFTELNSALNNGITPLNNVSGTAEIVMNVTTRSQDSAGNPDFAVIDVHKVVVADFIADDIASTHRSRFSSFGWTPVDVEGELPDRGIASPGIVRDFIISRLEFYGPGGGGPQYLFNVEALKDEVIVEADGTVNGRAIGSIPISPIDIFHQGAYDVRQVA